MPVLNILNFPPDLLETLKVQAAQEGVTLRELVIRILTDSIPESVKVGEGYSPSERQRYEQGRNSRIPPGARVYPLPKSPGT